MVNGKRMCLGLGLLALVAYGCAGVEDDVAAPADEVTGTRSEALVTNNFGFAWVNHEKPSVDPLYAYNSKGGAISYTGGGPSNRGRYFVRFNGLGANRGNVQVSSYGAGPERCRIDGWGPTGADLVITVQCHTPTGAPADASFVVFYNDNFGTSSSFSQRGGYLTTASATPAGGGTNVPLFSVYSWNGSGALNSVRYDGTGKYMVTLPGVVPPTVNLTNASFHVTAYGEHGFNFAQHCKVGGWGSTPTSTSVAVRCYDELGAPTDSQFSFSMMPFALALQSTGGHAWVNELGVLPPEFAAQRAQYACRAPGVASFSESGPDRTARFSLVTGPTNAVALVTGFGDSIGPDPRYCKVVNWAGTMPAPFPSLPDVDDVYIRVRCFDAAGGLVNAPFTISYTHRDPPAPC